MKFYNTSACRCSIMSYPVNSSMYRTFQTRFWLSTGRCVANSWHQATLYVKRRTIDYEPTGHKSRRPLTGQMFIWDNSMQCRYTRGVTHWRLSGEGVLGWEPQHSVNHYLYRLRYWGEWQRFTGSLPVITVFARDTDPNMCAHDTMTRGVRAYWGVNKMWAKYNVFKGPSWNSWSFWKTAWFSKS